MRFLAGVAVVLFAVAAGSFVLGSLLEGIKGTTIFHTAFSVLFAFG